MYTGCMGALEGITDALVRGAAQGDLSQRDRLFILLTPQVRIMVNARLQPTAAQAQVAEDLVQEVMLALSEGLATLQRQTVSGLRAFASVVVSRRVADLLQDKARLHRHANGRRPQSLDSAAGTHLSGSWVAAPLWATLSASGHSPMSEVGHDELFHRIVAALSELKEEHRTVITLAFFDQLDTHDIAERLGITRPAATMLLMRAIRTLRRTLTGTSRVMPASFLGQRQP